MSYPTVLNATLAIVAGAAIAASLMAHSRHTFSSRLATAPHHADAIMQAPWHLDPAAASLLQVAPVPCEVSPWADPPRLLAIERDATGALRAVLRVSDAHATIPYRLSAGQGLASIAAAPNRAWYVAHVASDHVVLRKRDYSEGESEAPLTLWLDQRTSTRARIAAGVSTP